MELVELLRELSQRLLDGLWAGHGQGKPSLEVLHLVHDQQGSKMSPKTERREQGNVDSQALHGACLGHPDQSHSSVITGSNPVPFSSDSQLSSDHEHSLPCIGASMSRATGLQGDTPDIQPPGAGGGGVLDISEAGYLNCMALGPSTLSEGA